MQTDAPVPPADTEHRTDHGTGPDAVARSAQRLRATGRRPRIALLLGSGWAGVADVLAEPLRVPYAELPAFAPPGVAGHRAELVLGRLGPHEVLVLGGRVHAYEHGDAAAMAGPIATLAALGVRLLVQTNAAGSLVPAMGPGALMLLADHLNLPQRSPLVGRGGHERFVDMAAAYDPDLRAQARALAAASGQALHEGVYAWVLGPQFETPAEIRMLQRLGAQAVGMSTVPETILARFHGLRVLALSLITNLGCGLDDTPLSHAQTLAAAQAASGRAVPLLAQLVAGLRLDDTPTA